MSKEAVREFWNNHVHDWKVAKSSPDTLDFFLEIEEYRFEKLHYLPKVVNFSGYKNKKILDVGCGTGNDLTRFAKGGAEVVGIDLASHSIELAKNNFAMRNLAGDFQVMDGEALEFEDNSFDMVYCHTVLHFTPDPKKMISEIARVLKPGGEAILMTVNKRSWLNFLHKLMKVEIDHLDAPIFYMFSIAEYQEMLKPFTNINIIPERFPVATKVHSGMKAFLYNKIFVGIYNKLPKSVIKNSGHHLMAFCRK